MCITREKVRLAGLLAMTLLLGGTAAQAQTTLRFKFREGEALKYVLDQKMKMEMKVAGKDVDMDMSQVVDLTWKINSVDNNGTAKMVQKFDRVRFSMNGPMGKVEYDSKDGKQPEGLVGQIIGPMLEAMAGAEFPLTMTTDGKVSDVKVPEKFAEALKNLPAGGAGGDLFSEDGIKRMINQSGIQLPDKAVEKGKSWENKVEMKMPFGKMKVDNVSTYEGPTTRAGKKLEQIAVKPKLTLEPAEDAPFTAKLKSQDAKGTAYFDNEAGRLVESNLTQTMDMELSAGGQNIGQKIEQTITMKLQDSAK
jgi:hypothetical protein